MSKRITMVGIGVGMLVALVGLVPLGMAASTIEPAPTTSEPQPQPEQPTVTATESPATVSTATPQESEPVPQPEIPMPPEDYPGDSTWDEANPEDTEKPEWLPEPEPQPTGSCQ